MNKILQNLELIRKERGIKQEVIAERLGVSPVILQKLGI